MFARYENFNGGVTPPHPFTKGIVFSKTSKKDYQAIILCIEALTPEEGIAISHSATTQEIAIWVSAKTNVLLEKRMKKIISDIEDYGADKVKINNN